MAIKEGVLLAFKNNTVAVEDLTVVGMSLSKNIIDVTTKDSSYWRAVLPGTRQGTINFEGFIDDAATEGFSELYADFNSQTVGTFEITTDVSGEHNYTGSGYIATLEMGGQWRKCYCLCMCGILRCLT